MSKTNDNRNQILLALDGKTFKELAPQWKLHLKRMFSGIQDEDEIHAVIPKHAGKVSLLISTCGKTVALGIKTGRSTVIHRERVSVFVDFLLRHGVEKSACATYLFYHFGDGTIKGNGEKRMTVAELRHGYGEHFDAATKKLQNKDLIEAILRRAFADGNGPNQSGIDYFYYGTVSFGYLASVDEALAFLRKKVEKTSPFSIGPFSVQPCDRNLERDAHAERERYIVLFKWAALKEDMKSIAMNSSAML